jgi:hypothetical protein
MCHVEVSWLLDYWQYRQAIVYSRYWLLTKLPFRVKFHDTGIFPQVFAPDMSKFALGGGGVHCLCHALKRDSVEL